MEPSHFFSQGQNLSQLAIFIVVFLLCWNLETLYGVSKNYPRWQHDRSNFWFLLTGGLSQMLLGFVFTRGLFYSSEHHFGLLQHWHVFGTVGQIVIAFIVWDFFYYVYHLVMHQIKAVWPFHAVHHSDPIMNVSTSLREHPVETGIRLGHYMFVSWVLAPAVWIVTLHQFVQIISKIIIHSNWRLPERADKYLSLVLLTPNMHHVHHHESQPYTDSNYGDLLSIWDRMFGTYRHLTAQKVRFGLDTAPQSVFSLDFLSLLKLPFNKKFRKAEPPCENPTSPPPPSSRSSRCNSRF